MGGEDEPFITSMGDQLTLLYLNRSLLAKAKARAIIELPTSPLDAPTFISQEVSGTGETSTGKESGGSTIFVTLRSTEEEHDAYPRITYALSIQISRGSLVPGQ